jgi:beta-galactosidase
MKKLLSLFLFAVLLAGTAFGASASAIVGQGVTFSYTAAGTQPFTQQWFKNGVAIPGATAPTYVIPSVVATDAGVYTVAVSNPAGTATSDNATLVLIIIPSAVVTAIATTSANH